MFDEVKQFKEEKMAKERAGVVFNMMSQVLMIYPKETGASDAMQALAEETLSALGNSCYN